jgi:hypothetical protein
MKNYLRTLKPIDFPSTFRFIGFIAFILYMSIVFGMGVWAYGVIYPDSILTNEVVQIVVSLVLGILFTLTVDFTLGVGRRYSDINDKWWRNSLILIPLWISLWILSFWPVISKFHFN